MVCLLLISQESKLKNVYLRRLRESSRIDVLEEDTFVIEINKHRYSFLEILTGGFIVVIIIGMLLLKLPIATRPDLETSWMTALFTSTIATCVTGLLLVDTAAHWTWFGQLVITMLMEVGGLGFMTFAVMSFLLIRRRMRLSTQLLTQEALNLDHLSQIRVVYLIIKLSLLIQGIGAIFLTFDLVPKYGLKRGLWLSIFQAISVFCNAGFDLFGIVSVILKMILIFSLLQRF